MSLTSGASVLVSGQILFKLVSFTLNQFFLRSLATPSIGLSQSIEFIDSFLIFLSTEVVRLSINHIPDSEFKKQKIIKFSLLSFILFIGFVTPVNWWCYQNLREEITLVQLSLLNLSTLIQILNEANYNINLYIHMNFTKRVEIESKSIILKSIIQFILFKHTQLDFIEILIYSKLTYSVTLFALYSMTLGIPTYTPIELNLSYFRKTYLTQIYKNLLTQGDQLILSSTLSLSSQGYYSIITNYGSLIVRLIFQPIEESTRLSITSLYNSNLSTSNRTELLNESLKPILQFYFYLILLIQQFTYLNVKFIIARVLPNATTPILITGFKVYFTTYIPLLALNGLFEALYFSITTSYQTYSTILLLNSIMFFFSCVTLIRQVGLIGLIVANLLNFTIRIAYCLFELRNVLSWGGGVNWLFLSVWGSSFLGQLWLFENGEVRTVREFGVSFGLGVVCCLCVLYCEWAGLKAMITGWIRMKRSRSKVE